MKLTYYDLSLKYLLQNYIFDRKKQCIDVNKHNQSSAQETAENKMGGKGKNGGSNWFQMISFVSNNCH